MTDSQQSCSVCDGKAEPFIVTVTGYRPYTYGVRYGDAEYHVNGLQAFRAGGAATTLWLAPGPDHGESA